jgi:hypothetical protein
MLLENVCQKSKYFFKREHDRSEHAPNYRIRLCSYIICTLCVDSLKSLLSCLRRMPSFHSTISFHIFTNFSSSYCAVALIVRSFFAVVYFEQHNLYFFSGYIVGFCCHNGKCGSSSENRWQHFSLRLCFCMTFFCCVPNSL